MYTYKEIIMAQVTIYMDNNLEKKIKELAINTGVSISKFISNALEQKVNNNWSAETAKLEGSWSEFVTLEEIRAADADDAKREAL